MARPKIINIKRVDTDSEKCPQLLKLTLRACIRDVFSRRVECADAVLSNVGIDAFLDLWWSHHHNIIRAFSFRPEWDWTTLSLHFDKQVLRPVNLYDAKKDYYTLLGRPHYLDRAHFSAWNYSEERVCPFQASSDNYLGMFHEILYRLYVRAFGELILEGETAVPDKEYQDKDAYLSADTVHAVIEFIDNHFISSETLRGRGAFCMHGINRLVSDNPNEFISFNKLPYAIFNKLSSLRDNGDQYANFLTNLQVYFNEHSLDFLADLYKSVGANQMSGDKGPIKTTITNKLVKSFYDWLTALTVGFSGNPFSLVDNGFDYYLNTMKSFIFFSENPLKVRSDDHEGYELVNRGTFEQLFARLQENCKGTYNRESFIISFHPCDMITCSLGYNWSSCQSWINDFQDLPSLYGHGMSYGGMYNRGNFQFMCGNGFIAYIPHEQLKDVPQYLWAKKKRCLLWVGDNLDCIRQNDFYPGHPKDQDSIALAKVIREFIQEVLSPFNFSNGTMDWKVKNLYKDSRYNSVERVPNFDKFTERSTPVCGRYDDPIFALSYLKTAVTDDADKKPYLNYALTCPRFDTGLPASSGGSWITTFFSSTRGTCPICGKHTSRGGICPKCSKELVEHNGKKVHPSDLVTINIDGVPKSFDLSEVEQLNNYVVADDGTFVNFKSAYKVFMPSGIKYFKELPSYVKQCKVCKEYFHPSFMIGDVCIEHFNSSIASNDSDVVVDIDQVLNTFLAGTLSFDCNDTDNLRKLLAKLDDCNVVWINKKKPSEFFPKNDINKRMYLSVNNGKLVLSTHALSTVVKVSNLFKKGGE